MIIAIVRTIITAIAMVVATIVIAGSVIVAGVFGVGDRQGSIYDWAPRAWSRIVLRAAGARVVVHGGENRHGARHIFVGNHVSWFDVFTVAAHLRWGKFVAKAELFKIPIFGPAMRYAGMIAIERENRSSARTSIDRAALAINDGASVIMFPEGTRGRSYALRNFKKGAFVLAIETHAPIVPVAIFGTMHVQPKGSFVIHPGDIHVHFLPPIATDHLAYDDRDALAQQAKARIAECLEREHGVARGA